MAHRNLKTSLSPLQSGIAIASLAALALVLVLFHVITISSAVIAPGRVVVQGNPRPVQSLEGGLVREIDVRNGDSVTAGEVLVRLDPTLFEINRDIIRGRLAELLARQSRLKAEEQGLTEVPAPVLDNRLAALDIGRYLTGQREIFQSRRAVMDSQKAQLDERIEQYRAQMDGLQAQVEAMADQIRYVSQEVDNLQALSDQDLVPESRLLELQGRQAALLGRAAQYRSELAQVSNAIRDADLQRALIDREFREKVVTELRDVTAGAEENLLELVRTEKTLERLDIRAPASGIIHEMQIWTVGGIIPPQQTIMTIVPVSDGVQFEARIQPTAVNTIHVGQKARIRFPAFDRRTTPELNGIISGISPDSVFDQATGQSFYRVDISISTDELVRLGAAELIPGMPVEAFLQTGDRSVLNFLVKPFTDQFYHAFREG